jgi:hypothetical protein
MNSNEPTSSKLLIRDLENKISFALLVESVTAFTFDFYASDSISIYLGIAVVESNPIQLLRSLTLLE